MKASFILRFKNFIEELDTKEYYRYLITAVVIFVLLVCMLFYFYSNKIAQLKAELRTVNKQREEARNLLERYSLVQQQKADVHDILSQDKTFKIKEYFMRTVGDTHLNSNLVKEPEIAEPQDLNNGYNEVKLSANFTNLSMQDVTTLLEKLESNRRIYTKELVITKAVQNSTIDLTVIIATLLPKLET